MSILIPDMKMPESCYYCPWWDMKYGMEICGLVEDTAENKIDYASRPSWCPLIEVPPHGRLIEEPKQLSYDGLVYISPYDAIGTAKYFLDQIRAMPTIIPAEEGEI